MAFPRFRKKSPPAAAAVAALLLAALCSPTRAGVLDFLKQDAADRAKSAGVVETAAEVRVPVASLASGKALFLSMPHEGVELRWFVLKSADGKYRAALDACDVCFRANKGYRQEGDKVVCNNCDMKFAASRIGEAKGGCNPHGIPFAIDGSSLVVKKADIVAGKRYFR
jgi:uncharacterized membrane protein